MKRRKDRKVSRAQLRNVVVETTQSMGAAFGEGIARYHAEKVEPAVEELRRLQRRARIGAIVDSAILFALAALAVAVFA